MLLSLCLLMIVCHVANSCLTSMGTGILYPRDKNYLVGENVTLQCILEKSTVQLPDGVNFTFNSSNIYFKLGKDVLSSEVEVLDDKQALMTIKNGQPKDNGMYYCMLKVDVESGKKDILVCPSHIGFGYPPENVTSFKCRSYYWKDLTCYWTAPVNPSIVMYRLSYRPDDYPMRLNCANKVTKTSCGWKSYGTSSSSLYQKYATNLTMFMTGSNGIGNDSFQKFIFNHGSIVVADKPESFTVTDKNSTYLFLNWKHPVSMKGFPPGLCYKILYGVKNSSMETRETAANETTFSVTNLIPNTEYLLHLQARSCEAPADVENDLWGPVSTAVGKTDSDIPWYSPNAEGIFFDTSDSNWKRNVIIYWKRVEQKFENGDDFHYRVSLEKIPEYHVGRTTDNIANIRAHHKLYPNLDLNSSYAVQIWSANANGLSTTHAKIIIPKNSEMLQRPLYIRPVFVSDGNYSVSWKASSSEVGSYTLVWCQGGIRCEVDLSWMTVSSKTTTVNLSLDKNRNYEFGVAANLPDGRQSSSLEWAPCIAYRNRDLGHMVEVKIDEITSHSLTISWKPTCGAQKAIIIGYEVVLCKKDCYECNDCGNELCKVQETKNVSDPEAESVVFDNLMPYSTYTGTVVAISKDGRSPESSEICNRTLSDAPSDPPVFLPPSSVTNTTMTLSWQPSKNTNGNVTHYQIHYREMLGEGLSHTEMVKDVRAPIAYSDQIIHDDLRGLKCFSNYSINISACVDTHCSPSSSPIFVKTSIGVPGTMDPPRSEVLNATHVRFVWQKPEEPNGPLDCYLLHLFRREGNNVTILGTVNVTGTSVELALNCSPGVQTSDSGTHLFSIQALNHVAGKGYLYGPISNTSETKLCLMELDMNNAIMIGIIVGCTLAFAVVILSLYSALRWMNDKVKKMKNIKVILPDGLQQPYSQSLNSYENFKNGLSGGISDPNLSPKLGYERTDSNSGDPDNNYHEDSFKNRHGSGTSHFSTTSTDELIGKQNQGQVTAPKNVTITGQKTMSKGDRNPSGDSSSGHDSISSSLTHHTNLSTDGSSSSEGSSAHGKDPQSSRDSGLDEESKPRSKRPTPRVTLPTNNHYLPTAPYSKLGLLENKCMGDYLPLVRGRHLNLYSHNLANSEPSITDLNQQPYTLEHHAQCDPSSPDVPYSKFGISHSVTDLMLEGIDLPESPLSSQPSPQDALPYSRFGLRRPPPPNQSSPYVTMGMALLTGPQKVPNQFLPSKMDPTPLVLKSPTKKAKNEVHPPDLLTTSDDAYSKLGLSSVTDNSGSPKIHPYLTLQEVRENEQNNHSLPDITISSRESSPLHHIPNQVRHRPSEPSSKSGYLPHQLIPSVIKAPEPVLPDFINCSNVLPITNALQDDAEVKIQGNNGYVTLNQVLGGNNNTKV